MTDLSNKPISYTGSHPLELAYRALLARAEAAEALAYERLEDMLFAEQRATDADLRAEAAEAEAARLAARLAELEAAQQWRPGTLRPDVPGWYQVGDIDVGVYELWYSGEAWYRSSFQRATYRTPPLSTPDFWRPIPPLPPAPQEPTQ